MSFIKIFFFFFIIFISIFFKYLNYNKNIIHLNKIHLIYCQIQNFGDSINFKLLNDITGKEIIKYNYCNNNFNNIFNFPNFSFIGSIFDKWFINKNNLNNRISTPIIIYGTGFTYEIKNKKYPIRNLDIRAIRGKLSLQNLKNCNIFLKKNLVLADPGLIALFFFNLKETKKKYSLCLIPHIFDQSNEILKKININNSIILNIKDENNFMKSLSKCKRVISSSLHGLILADSLFIPNIRMKFENNRYTVDFKFNDYYSSFNLEPQKYINLKVHNLTEKDLIYIDKNYNITKEMVLKKQCELLNNFPFPLEKKYKLIFNKKCKKNILNVLIKKLI